MNKITSSNSNVRHIVHELTLKTDIVYRERYVD